MAELRNAACRGAAYGTDRSADAHDSHQFFPHQLAEAADCPGWTASECDAAALIRRLLGTGRDLPGLVLQCHPAVEYAMMQVIIPGYQEFIDPLSMPLQKTVGGIPVIRTVAAGRGAWKLVSGKSVIADGVVRDD